MVLLNRPVGTNLMLVRRGSANSNNFTIHESGASEASGASNGVGSRGPLKLDRTQDLQKRGGRVTKLRENWLIWPPNRLNLHDLVVKRVGGGPNRPIRGSAPALKGPWRGPGAELRRGSRGQSPRKLLGFSICKRPRKALLEIFFSLNQPRSACQWYRNVSIK